MQLTTYLSATPKAALVLAHGAGAGQTSPFMVRFARGMALRDINAATFDFPYTAAGRKVPDRAPVLEESWREALAAAKNEFAGAADRHRRQIDGRADGVPHRGPGLRGHRRRRVPRLSAPSARPAREAPRCAPADDCGADALRPRHRAMRSARQPRSPRSCRRSSAPSCTRSRAAITRSRCRAAKGMSLEDIMDTVAAWIKAGR